jgi:FkbM family methyltransferase
VAVEANPLLVEKSRQRFAAEIKNKKLVILNVGIASKKSRSTFWVNEDNDEWSSFIKEVGCRSGTKCHRIEVRTIPFREIIKKYGKPYFIKIDIEGNDMFCLKDLTQDTAPRYISIEAHRLEYLAILYNLGYRKFKCVDQSNHNFSDKVNNESLSFPSYLKLQRWFRRKYSKPKSRFENWVFPPGSSGPFGEETPGEWEDLEPLAYNWLHYRFQKRTRGTLNMRGWYDFHAKK